MFLAGILIGAISLIIGEVICRLCYEYTYLFIRIAGDTRSMREKLNDGLTIKETKAE